MATRGPRPSNPGALCFDNPEIVSESSLNFAATVHVKTVCKLTDLKVTGACECKDEQMLLVVVIDGSDSFDKHDNGDHLQMSTFKRALELVSSVLNGIQNKANVIVSVVQFSGIREFSNIYSPGHLGRTHANTHHFRIEIDPTCLGNIASIDERLNNVRALNGNAELFLALQDLTMPQFLNKLFAAATIQNKDLKPIMVIITNDEWDFCPLKNGHGLGTVTKEKVATAVNTYYKSVIPVIVRDTKDSPKNNDDFIKTNLAARRGTEQELLRSDWTDTSENVRKNILELINSFRQ